MTNIVDYCTFKKTEKIKNILQIKEKYLINEIEILKNELRRVKEEINRVKSVPLLMGQFLEAIDKNTAIVSSSAGTNAVVKILSTVDKELLVPNTSVALHRHSSAIVDVLPPEADSTSPTVGEEEKPNITYDDIDYVVEKIVKIMKIIRNSN